MSILYSPLEQFEIIPLISFRVGSFDLSFSNSSLLIFFSIFFIFFLGQTISVFGNGIIIPSRFQIIFEMLYFFIYDMVIENLGKVGQNYFPFIFSLFFFLVFCNVLGLVPYSFTVTSHFIVTFILSFIVWVGKLYIGIKHHGIKLLGLLLPGGVPVPIIPFFVFVEFLSFLIPLVALGVRLFANIIAGHILLKVIVGFCWSILIAGGFLFFIHFIPIIVLFLLFFLETAVAFIQAYVFTMLTCLIIGDMVRGGHLFFLSSLIGLSVWLLTIRMLVQIQPKEQIYLFYFIIKCFFLI